MRTRGVTVRQFLVSFCDGGVASTGGGRATAACVLRT